MAFKPNGISLKTNGDYFVINGKAASKFVVNGVTVWEKITKVSPPNSAIVNYIDVQGGSAQSSECGSHAGAPLFKASVWYIDEGESDTDDKTFVIRPKAPYSNIKATLHWQTSSYDGGDGAAAVWINGTEIYYSGQWDHPEQGGYVTVEGSSITIRVLAKCDGWEGHWKTEASVCMYDVTVSS